MRRAGDGWRAPRPTTCGRSTGGWPTPDRRPVAVVTDSSADLADSVLDRHRIALVPLQVIFGDETFRDRVELKPEEFYRRLRAARELPDHLAARAGRLRAGAARRAGRGGRGRRRCCSRAACRAPSPRRRRRCGPPGSRASTWWTAGRPRSGVGHAGAAGGRAGGGGLAGPRDRRGARAGPGPVGDAADGRPVRQPAPVGTGLARARRGSRACWT